jgi:outer membrane receptor protein involved in Fe transport
LLLFGFLCTGAAAPQPCTVSGDVRDAADGAHIARARVTVEEPDGTRVGSAPTDAAGAFCVRVPAPGPYVIVAAAPGYQPGSRGIVVSGGDARPVTVALARQSGLRELGHVAVSTHASATADSVTHVASDALAADGALRLADALSGMPAITVTGDAAAPGGDAYVSLRGLRPAESRVLLDGHPIGPIGVRSGSPDVDGTVAGFNFQDAPYFALRDVDVAYGPAAGGEGSDAVGGTIDLRTIDPSMHTAVAALQEMGTQGRATSALQVSGAQAKIGYAFADGVAGTYGQFPGSAIAQTGLRGTDFTSSTLGALTYHVSGDYVLRGDLAKLTYSPAPNEKITLSAYDATSWSDKTGEGDNDFNPFGYVLAGAPVGNSPACPHGVLVTEDKGPACLTPASYAVAASGPAGGGPGAWQALRNQDYDARFTEAVGRHDLAVDLFDDEYAFSYHRDASSINGPLDQFLDHWATQGAAIGDAISSGRNHYAFGLSWLRQTLTGTGTATDSSATVVTSPASRVDRAGNARADFAIAPRMTLTAGASLNSSSIDPATHLDPQLSLVYRPNPNDAFRAGATRTSDEPALQSDRVTLLPVGALNPNCGAIARATPDSPSPVTAGSGPSNDVAAETGSDVEFGYEHRFGGGGNLGLTLYDANVANRIVTGAFAAGNSLPPSSVSALESRIEDFCGIAPAPGAVVFTLDRPFNAAGARLRGVELTGAARAARGVALRYAYDVQSVVVNGLPSTVLRTDPTLVNGLQVFGVPLHKATLGVDWSTPGFEFELDGHAVGPNNPQQLPGYAYADASLSKNVSRRVSLALDADNVFNSHAQRYGLVGLGLPYATNQFGNTSPFLQQFNERYGLAPASLTFSAKLRL